MSFDRFFVVTDSGYPELMYFPGDEYEYDDGEHVCIIDSGTTLAELNQMAQELLDKKEST